MRDISPRFGTADIIERCVDDLHTVAFDFRLQAKSISDVENRITEVERICLVLRKAVRG
jgi:hypothetical protein